VGIDAGGTFTDLAMVDEDGRLRVVKVPSTPGDPSQAVFRALARAAAGCGRDTTGLLRALQSFVLGTTVATNIMVERRGATVGLICTEGFRDTLAIRRGRRKYMWDFRSPHPPELVPRSLRLPVRERIDGDGGVAVPLREGDVRDAVAAFEERGVEAVAIGLFNAFLNDEHERRVEDLVRDLFPGAFVSRSTDVLPVMGEYERLSTTVINAYVGPRTVESLTRLARELGTAGMTATPCVMQNNGGIVDLPSCIRRPVGAILSGPAAGAAVAALYAGFLGGADVVFLDMGGTSTDITLARQGRAAVTDEIEINGYHMALPSVEMTTIGTGGGTIALVDEGGLLRVGPRSAGAEPGPACYGRGATEPTITDANLVLGRLNAANFLGGEMRLEEAAAREAVERGIARRLGLSPEDAAIAIVRVANQRMANAIRLAAVQQGQDLRSFTLVSAGGAAALHASAMARTLGISRVYVPREAAVACAVGMLQSDMRRDYVRSHLVDVAAAEAGDLTRQFTHMREQARTDLLKAGLAPDEMAFEAAVDLRYAGQQWQVTLPVRLPLEPSDLDGLGRAFHARHDALYGYHDPGGRLQLVKLRVIGMGATPGIDRPAAVLARGGRPAPGARRPVYFDWAGGPLETPIFSGTALGPGDELAGPAIIEEATTTILVDRGDTVTVDAHDNYCLLAGGSAPR
jgi:N-methylhydantoinase A